MATGVTVAEMPRGAAEPQLDLEVVGSEPFRLLVNDHHYPIVENR